MIQDGILTKYCSLILSASLIFDLTPSALMSESESIENRSNLSKGKGGGGARLIGLIVDLDDNLFDLRSVSPSLILRMFFANGEEGREGGIGNMLRRPRSGISDSSSSFSPYICTLRSLSISCIADCIGKDGRVSR